MAAKFDNSDYVDVATRIAEFRKKHPQGSLRPVNPLEPWRVVEVAGKAYIAYTAAAYRTPDDPLPGIGTAWEPVPGPTSFTKDSELQNAETSAWGRAMVAALAVDAKKIATAEDVRNRQQPETLPDPMATEDQLQAIDAWLEAAGPVEKGEFMAWRAAQKYPGRSHLTASQAENVLRHMQKIGSAGSTSNREGDHDKSPDASDVVSSETQDPAELNLEQAGRSS